MIISKNSKNKDVIMDKLENFKGLNFFMLRVPLLSTQFYQKCFARDGIDSGEIIEKTIEELIMLACDPLIREAIATTSISLLHSLDKLSTEKDLRKRKQTAISFIKYLIRMSTRPTPFGILAGVTAGTFDNHTHLKLKALETYRKRTRPDMEWLMGFITKLEQRIEIVEQLKIQGNSTVLQSGNRLEIPYTTQYDQQSLAQKNKTAESISIRATEVVLYTLEQAKQPIAFQEVLEKIQYKYPETSLEKIKKLLWQLFQNEFLLSELRPPLMMNHVSPLDYVVDKIKDIQGIDPEIALLEEIKALIDEYDHIQLGQGEDLFLTIASKMKILVETQNPLQVDLAISTKYGVLNKTIAQDIAEAAECLWRLSPGDTSTPGLKNYRKEFIEKYGTDREVPVLELLDEDRGLGAPNSYRFPPSRREVKHDNTPVTVKKLENFLLQQLPKVIKNRQVEIEITLAILEQLEIAPPDSREAPVSLEMYGTIIAASERAIDDGDYEIVLGHIGSAGAGKTFGRFLDILPPNCRQEMYRINELEKEHFIKDVVTAEIVYMPYAGRAANVVVSENIRDYEITIATNSSKADRYTLPVNDLLIGATSDYFYIKSKSLGKRVVVTTGHMLNILNAPNLFRFLMEVSQEGIRNWSPIHVGTMSEAPYLPRIRFKKIILSPATWKLNWQILNAKKEEVNNDNFASYIKIWRSEWQVPRFVFLTEGDNRILLDLKHPWHLEILLEELIHKQQEMSLTLSEMPTQFAENWLHNNSGGYIGEIVVPVMKKHKTIDPNNLEEGKQKEQTNKALEQVNDLTTINPSVSDTVRNKYPGSEWLYLKLYGNSSRAEEFIAFALRDFCREFINTNPQQLVKKWFFIRYADPQPHFRLRFNGDPKILTSKLLPILHNWCMQLNRDGLLSRVVIDTYEQEIERYGGPDLIADVETVFYHDSLLTSDLLFLKRSGQLTLEFEAIAVISIIHLLTSLHWDLEKQFTWLDKLAKPKEFLEQFRKQRNLYMQLGNKANNWQNLRNQKHGEYIYNSLVARGKSIITLAEEIKGLEQRQTLWNSQDNIIRSLIHMHCNRLFGTDRQKENKIIALTRHTLYNLRQFKIAAKGQGRQEVVSIIKEAK